METQANALQVVRGADAAWKLTLRDRRNKAITTYTSAAALSAQCWRGDDQAALFAPAASWIDPALGTIRLAVSAAQTQALAPDSYDLLIAVAAGGQVVKHRFGPLSVSGAPGLAEPRPVYSTSDDLRRHAGSWLQALLRLDADQSGFAEERADAREELEELAHRHYRGGSGIDRQQSLIQGAGGRGGLVRTGRRSPWLSDRLAAGGLVVTKRVREFCSLWALGVICRRQITPDKDNGYRSAAAYFFGSAEDLAATLALEIDSDGDGLGDVVIDLSAADCLRG